MKEYRFDTLSFVVQKFTEDLLVKWFLNISKKFNVKHFVFSGGVAQNIKATKKILENEDKREIMRKEARNEAEKWDWNQATLQLQNYYAETLKEID